MWEKIIFPILTSIMIALLSIQSYIEFMKGRIGYMIAYIILGIVWVILNVINIHTTYLTGKLVGLKEAGNIYKGIFK